MLTKTLHKRLRVFRNTFHYRHTMLCSTEKYFTEYFSHSFLDMIKQVLLILFPLFSMQV